MFKKIPKKAIVIGASALLLLGLGAAGLFTYLTNELHREIVTDVGTQQTQLTPALEKATQEAQQRALTGDVEGAIQLFDEAIESSENDTQKAILYLDKSVAIGPSEPQQAIADAEASFELQESYITADYLALLYEEAGNTQEALRYYQIALDLFRQIEFVEGSGQADEQYYENKIQELQQ